jgi:hypothetical protein
VHLSHHLRFPFTDKAAREAESNQLLFTPSFLQLTQVQALAANSQMYFGNDIPDTLLTGAAGAQTVMAQNSKKPSPSPSSDSA